jgi:acetyltransferase-like isoleucine patch superfamily enzyme
MQNIFFDTSKLKYCGKDVIIGKTVRIRKPEECIIGDGTIIDDFTYISCAIEIGTNCHIASNTTISGGNGKFIMGDYSTLSNHCSVHCGSSDYSKISIDIPSSPPQHRFGGETKQINLGHFVTIGAHSTILPGANIPDGFSCGAYTLIKNKEYKPFSLYVGVPAKFHAYRNIDDFKQTELYKEYYKNAHIK